LSIAVLCVLYLVIWTSVDMPKRTDDFEIVIELEEDKSTVAFHAGCASSSTFWGIVVLGVESFVLPSATILANSLD